MAAIKIKKTSKPSDMKGAIRIRIVRKK